jgi:hypothetical protein
MNNQVSLYGFPRDPPADRGIGCADAGSVMLDRGVPAPSLTLATDGQFGNDRSRHGRSGKSIPISANEPDIDTDHGQGTSGGCSNSDAGQRQNRGYTPLQGRGRPSDRG